MRLGQVDTSKGRMNCQCRLGDFFTSGSGFRGPEPISGCQVIAVLTRILGPRNRRPPGRVLIAMQSFRRISNLFALQTVKCKRNMAISVDISQANKLREKYLLLEADASMHLSANSVSNSKIISFVRHAEGIHNAVIFVLISGFGCSGLTKYFRLQVITRTNFMLRSTTPE